MGTELLFVLCVLLCLGSVLGAAAAGKESLYALLVLNLVLVSLLGSKLVLLGGYTANAGNIFYACAFVVTYILIERYGKEAGVRTVWLGIAAVAFVSIMTRLVVQMAGADESLAVNRALEEMFSASVQVRAASLAAFVFAQSLNIWLFSALRVRGMPLPLCILGAAALAQAVDTLIFFSIAFPALSAPLLLEVVVSGWLVKMAIISAAVPMLYLVSLRVRARD